MSSTLYPAYWISPEGELFGVTRHIHFISSNLEKFGFTRQHYEDVYIKQDEKLGIEGKARVELMREAMINGWIRARYNENDGWVVEFSTQKEDYLSRVEVWAAEIRRLLEINNNFPIRNVRMNYIDVWFSYEEDRTPETNMSYEIGLEEIATGIYKSSCRFNLSDENTNKMKLPYKLKIIYKDEEIIGEYISLNMGEITMKLIQPKSDLELSSWHIMSHSLPNTRFHFDNNLSILGVESSINLLRDLYDLHNFVEINGTEISSFIKNLSSKYSDIYLENQVKTANTNSYMQSLKQKFKENLITQNEYMNQLKKIKSDRVALDYKLHLLIDADIIEYLTANTISVRIQNEFARTIKSDILFKLQSLENV